MKNLCKLGLKQKFGLRTKSDLFFKSTSVWILRKPNQMQQRPYHQPVMPRHQQQTTTCLQKHVIINVQMHDHVSVLQHRWPDQPWTDNVVNEWMKNYYFIILLKMWFFQIQYRRHQPRLTHSLHTISEIPAPQNLTYCVHARGGWKRVGFAKAVCLFKPLNGRSTYCVEITNRLK